MPQYELPSEGVVTTPDGEKHPFYGLDGLIRAYIEALFWTESEPGTSREDRDDDRVQWDNDVEAGQQKDMPGDYGYADLSGEALADIRRDCDAFRAKAADLLALLPDDFDESRVGHDFWLTRNGHGAGFWDRDELDFTPNGYTATLGDLLTEQAQAFGEAYVEVGDDGKVYHT